MFLLRRELHSQMRKLQQMLTEQVGAETGTEADLSRDDGVQDRYGGPVMYSHEEDTSVEEERYGGPIRPPYYMPPLLVPQQGKHFCVY